MIDFGNVLTAMVTPFKKDGSVDYETTEKLSQITKGIISEIRKLEQMSGISKFKEKSYNNFTKIKLQNYIQELKNRG